MTDRQDKLISRKLSVAPMMEWTDRHCRYVHRLFAPHALLYTEMIVAAAVVRGNARRLLEHDPQEHPVALQLGGCDPRELATAARIGAELGYDEINLNVGCPSDRVKSGAFGACLMLKPPLVAECVARMREATRVPITVKCRIGIDERDDYDFFSCFVDALVQAGVDALIVHARAAILQGLSPKENREIPPLKYDYVHRLKRDRPGLAVVLNGGLPDLAAVIGSAGGRTRRRDARPRGVSPPRGARRNRAGGDRPGLAHSRTVANHRIVGALRTRAGPPRCAAALDHAPPAWPDGRARRGPRVAPVPLGDRGAPRLGARMSVFGT